MSTEAQAARLVRLAVQQQPEARSGSACGGCCQPTCRWRFGHLGLSLMSAIGWLALPKCPLCLAAQLAIISGLTMSASLSRFVYHSMAILAAVCFLLGLLRLRYLRMGQSKVV